MTQFKVLLNVDGEDHEEIVNAPDAKVAMTKALKLHPTRVEGVIPLEEQLSIQPQDHPGTTTIDDVEQDPAMAAIGDAIAAESGGGEPYDEGYQGHGDNLDVEPPVVHVTSDEVGPEDEWEDEA